MATAAVDLPYLSNYLSVPEPTITTLVEAPTVELVHTLLQAIAVQAREHDADKADKLRLEVELENAVRSNESRVRGLKSTVEKSLKEVSELRNKLTVEENARSALESQLRASTSTSSSTTSELETLRSRIASLESSNRDTLSLLDSKSTAHDRLAEELSAQQQRTNELRREISTLEQSVQAATSATTTAKFRESSLQQELDLVRRRNDWFETELKTKTAEASKTRKEKVARIAELQRQNDDANATIDSLRRNESTLRTRLDELTQKVEESFAKIQRLQEDAAKEQESFRSELEGAQRLAGLFESSAKTARERLQDVQSAYEQSKEEAAEELGRYKIEAETERSEKEAAEERVMELEVVVERMEADVANARNATPTPGTPRRPLNGMSSPYRDGSFTPTSARIKGGLSFTQMYTEYSNAKAELDLEKRRNEKLTATVDEMIQDLESKQPEIEEMRAEHERLEGEVIEMTSLLDEVGKERDKAKKESRKWEGQVDGLQREGDLLRQQLRDLSVQIRMLLSDIHARDGGEDPLDEAQQRQLKQMARGELDEASLEQLSTTGKIVSQRLIQFKNIQEMQEQNANLLRLVRQMSEQIEGEDAQKAKSQHAQDHEQLEALRVKVEKYKDEMKSMVTKSQSYIKERDMFRRMLQHRGQLGPNADLNSMFGQSIQSGAPGTPSGVPMQSIEQSPSAKDAADLSKVIKEMQLHFDAYRDEASTDQRALKEQADRLSREKGDLQAEISRINSQLSLARERYEMLQANYNVLQSGNRELQKRLDSVAENAAKQDLKTQQVAEEVIEARAMVDSLRNETANLKAEKELWKRIEKRLGEDNESLMNERNRLNSLITSLQNLQNERELSDSETRRRLQAQVESLDAELQTTKRKLGDEVEESKKMAQRREYEQQQSQKNVDDLRAGLSVVREELVAARTTKDHLQARVDELTIELKSAEERVQVLQPRPTPRADTQGESQASEGQATTGGDNTLSREQELAVEVSELRRDLELSKSELEGAKEQVEQYKAISQSSEEELQSMNDTHDQYREETDRALHEKDSKIRDLEGRVEDMSAELTRTNAELNNLHDHQSEKFKQFETEKAALETEIVRLRDEDERHATMAQFQQGDLKAQAEIAQQAQQSYENELVKHAEAAKALQKVRGEYALLRTEAVELRTEAEAAKATVAQNESSWEEIKERYERELVEMRTQKDNVDSQNRLLHQQLERVTGQISALQQQRTTLLDDNPEEEPGSGTSADRSVDELRELVRYLREAKDIVDVQLDLSTREAQRLKQQLEYSQSQLDETRLKLDQERQDQTSQSRSAITHNELVEKITELNLYRESTVTLRNEARNAQTQLAEKAKQVEELLSQVQPLQATVQELESTIESKDGEMKLLQEDRDRYQQRNQQILQKYDRIDPAELEGLKEQLVAVQGERDQLKAEEGNVLPLKEQIANFPEQIRKAQEESVQPWKDRQEKFIQQSKDKVRSLNMRIAEMANESQGFVQEKAGLEQQLGSIRQELEQVKLERDQAINNKTTGQPTHQEANHDVEMENGEVDENTTEAKEPLAASGPSEREQKLEAELHSAQARCSEEENKAKRLQEEVNTRQERISQLEEQVSQLQREIDSTNQRLAQLQSSQQAQESSGAAHTALTVELQQVKGQLDDVQREADELRAKAAVAESIATAPADDRSKTIEEQVSEQITAIQSNLEAIFQQRADKMRAALSKRLPEAREQTRAQLEAEHLLTIDRLRHEHEQEISSLREAEGQIKTDAQAQDPAREPGPEWKPSDNWVKDLVANNAVVKAMVTRNITLRLNQERETLAQKVVQEQAALAEQRIVEVQQQCEKQKEKDVAMEVQRQRVKLSMAEGKARTLTARCEIVQQAATETPQRAVGEVWEIAKVAKAAPVAAPAAAGGNVPRAPEQGGGPPQPIGTGSPQVPTANNVVASNAGPRPTQPADISTRSPGQYRPPTQQSPAQASPSAGLRQPAKRPSNANLQQNASQESSAAADMPRTMPEQQDALEQAVQPEETVAEAAPPQDSGSMPLAGQQQSTSQLPTKPPQSQQQHHAGTGPGALRSLLGQGQSAIPRGGGPARGRGGGRGGPGQTSQLPNAPLTQQSSLPRGGGRGRGQGRGGHAQHNHSQAGGGPTNQNSAGSGGRGGNMNAGARQFVPGGQKRGRDEGMDGAGDGGNAGKRPRGGGGGN
ncbi:MAG: hypothetical protein M1817_005861 [Caeruleum heppii]|nr:MAG: hypothetical protein M1817_005861 [Caeruleum heppii]